MRRLASLLILIVALTSICGHLTGIVYLYHWGSNTAGMGINTSLCLLAIAILFLTGNNE